MLRLVVPSLEDLWFREKLINDEKTMEYNKKWGGTIPFPKNKWKAWYDYWVRNPDSKRFYRYILEIIYLSVKQPIILTRTDKYILLM